MFTTVYQVREENAEIMKWWSMVVATELAQIDKDIKVGPSFEKKNQQCWKFISFR